MLLSLLIIIHCLSNFQAQEKSKVKKVPKENKITKEIKSTAVCGSGMIKGREKER